MGLARLSKVTVIAPRSEYDSVAKALAQFEDFHGWDLHAAWDDFKFGLKHYSDFERIAMVGETKWEAWMSRVCKPFTKAKVRYFSNSEVDKAWNWLQEGVQPMASG